MDYKDLSTVLTRRSQFTRSQFTQGVMTMEEITLYEPCESDEDADTTINNNIAVATLFAIMRPECY